MNFHRVSTSALAAALLLAAAPAQAAVLFSVAPDLTRSQEGICRYNTTCGLTLGNVFAAQRFTLAEDATLTGAGFNAIVRDGIFGTGVNWQIRTVDNDLPGTALFSGVNAPLSNQAGPVGARAATTEYSFALPDLSLAAGDYFLAFQNITANFSDFLSRGVSSSGAAESVDGGATWRANYGFNNYSSVAISISGTVNAPPPVGVPEPAGLGLLGLGIALLAAPRRRRATASR